MPEPVATGTYDGTVPSQVITPRTAAVESIFGTPSHSADAYNNVYVRRRRGQQQQQQQQQEPARRYPLRSRHSPDKFTFE